MIKKDGWVIRILIHHLFFAVGLFKKGGKRSILSDNNYNGTRGELLLGTECLCLLEEKEEDQPLRLIPVSRLFFKQHIETWKAKW